MQAEFPILCLEFTIVGTFISLEMLNRGEGQVWKLNYGETKTKVISFPCMSPYE